MNHVVNIQVTVDCADPHAQAGFWAAALGWVVERNTEMIRSLLDQGVAAPADVIEVHDGLAWRTPEAVRHPEHDAIREIGGAARLLFQVVEEPKTTKNRWHLDVNVGRDNIDAEVARLVELRARAVAKVDQPGGYHTTMADPEGNLSCLQ